MCDPNEARHPLPPQPSSYLNSGATGGGNGVGGPPLPLQEGGVGAGVYDDYRGGGGSNTGYRSDYDDGYRPEYGSPNCPSGPQTGGPQSGGPPIGGGNDGGGSHSGGGSNAPTSGGGSGYDTPYYDHDYNDEYGYEERDAYRKDPGYRERDRDRSHRADRRIHERRRGRPMDRPRRDRDRDRDRGFNRDRDRSRSRDGRDRKDRNPRDRNDRNEEGFDCDSSSRDSGESFRDRDSRDNCGDRAGERWMTDTPTHTILLRGLRYHIEEKDILAELMSIGLSVKDVRLMRKSSGASRGFAFVEFQNVADAQRWMEQNQVLNNYPKTFCTGTVDTHYTNTILYTQTCSHIHT